ncbi:MAG: HNH endonuclease [Pseudoxanthomonas sp.]
MSVVPYPVPRDGIGFGVSLRAEVIKDLILHIQSGYCVDPSRGQVYGRSGLLVGTVCADGYVRCGPSKSPPRTWYAHRVIWEAVNGAIPAGMHVDHMNAKRSDNRIANLQLLTPKENYAMTCARGNRPRGEQVANAKLTPAKVRSIRRSSASTAELAKRFGVCQKTIRLVRARKTWGHVVTKVRPKPPSKRKS